MHFTPNITLQRTSFFNVFGEWLPRCEFQRIHYTQTSTLTQKIYVASWAAVGMGIPMGMGVGWVWGLWWIPMGLLDLIWFVNIELWCSCITQYSTEYILWYHIQMAYMTKNKIIYASNKNTQGVGYGYGGYRDSVDMGIPTGFSVGMGWVWALKFNPRHGSSLASHVIFVDYKLTISKYLR